MWDLAARRPWPALLIVLGLSIVAAAGIGQIETQGDFVDTVPEHDGLAPYRDMLQRLDGIRFVAVYMPHDPSHASPHLRDPSGFDALVQDQAHLTAYFDERFPGTFSHTLSVYEGMRAGNYMLEKVVTAGNPRPESYAVPDDPITFQAVRDRGLEDGSFDDVLAADGQSSLLLAFFATKDNGVARTLSGEAAQALADWSSPTGVTGTPEASGLLYSSHVVDEQNRSDVPFWGAWALGAVALVLWWLVRRPANVLIAAGAAALATLWTFGTLGWLGLELNFLSVFLAPVVIGIGVDHSVHVLHRGEESGDIAHAARHAGPAVTVAALTTAAGLAVLLLVPAPLFSQIGGIAAVGILWSLVAALTFVPAAASMLPRRPARPLQGGSLAWFAKHAGGAITIAIVAIITIAAIASATQTRLESGSAENEFPQDDPVIRLQHRIEAEYGAFQRAYIVVRGDITDPAALAALHQATGQAAGLPLFREASSVADILLADEATDQGAADIAIAAALGITGQAPTDAERLPQTRDEARQRLDALYDDPLWRGIAPFTITQDYTLAIVAITVEPWKNQGELTALRDALSQLADAIQGDLPSHDVAAAGAPLNRAAIIAQSPLNVLMASLGTAAVVGAILAVAWRKRGLEGIKVAAIGVAIVVVAAAWLLGSIPALDKVYDMAGTGNNAALNDMFLLAFAITVAVGIDDLVHLASRFWEERDAGADRDTAMCAALHHAGRAITGTTVTTFVAFAVLSGVYFLQSKNLAILTALGALSAYTLTVFLAPLALRRRVAAPPVPAAAAARP